MPRAGDLAAFFTDPLWGAQKRALRAILSATPLDEALKWGAACYTWQAANVAIIGVFRDGCRLAFFKGTLIDDPEGALILTGPNSRASKYLSFQTEDQIVSRADQIRDYVARAIAVEKSGQTVHFAKDDLTPPDELTDRLNSDDAFRTAWQTLTPGRKRGYVLYFSGAKHPATRVNRIAKHAPRILQGKGMHDR